MKSNNNQHSPPDTTLIRYTHQWGVTSVPFTGDHPQDYQQDHDQVYQAHQHLTQSAALRSLMLLSGPNGIGKSRLLGHWRDQLNPRLYGPIAITQASLSHAGLLSYLARKLGKPSGTRSTNLMHLEEAFAEIGDKTAVIILDEAQNYNQAALEEVRLLLGIDLAKRPAFSLILVGDDYLLGGLKLRSHRALYTRIACHYHLAPWKPEEIAQLLLSSQKAVGHSETQLDSAALDLVISASHGLPRMALQVALAAWIVASKEKATMITAKHVQSILKMIPAVNDSQPPQTS